MNSLLFAVVLIFITTILSNAENNMTDIEDKIRNQRRSLEETARKLQESSRQQRMKHEEQLKASRERIEKIKAEASQRTRPSARSREPKTEETTSEATTTETAKTENTRTPEVKEAQKKLNDFIASEGGKARPATGSNRASTTLELHGVDNSLIEELGRMATSSIPRDAMIQHVAKHFPEKKQDEWNEIVLSALSVKGKHAPDTSATDHALRNEARLKQLKFERSKASAEAKSEQKDL